MSDLTRVVEDAVGAALVALDPADLVRARLPKLPPKRARVRVVAIGKAAPPMMRAALDSWADRVERALLVVPDDRAVEPDDRAELLRAPHPLPDARSERAADTALDLARALGPGDVLLALVSGGASSLLAAPPRGVELERKRALVARLLASGAPIHDVNLVRRHLSRVKGGRLGRAANGARVLTLLISDVVDGAPHDVGSGPSVPDPTTIADAERVLRARGEDALDLLVESPKSGDFPARSLVLADPGVLAARVATELAARGIAARVVRTRGERVEDIVEERLAGAASLEPGHAVVSACEPTIVVPASAGRGGRAGWIALAAARRLPDDCVLACIATDGRDGSSGSAGAIVTRARAEALDDVAIERALAERDDAGAHARMDTAVRSIPPGHNLTDVHVIARRARAR